jgi:hypothetical protein
MRKYQEAIYSAIVRRGTWGGNNSVVTTKGCVTEVYYYGSKIAVVNHIDKTATLDYCGYHTVSTGARINAVKEFCERYGYKYEYN